MKPPPFEYRRASSVPEALGMLGDAGADTAVLAGGQSLIPLLNLRFARPDVLVDINRIPGLDGITVTAESVEVGALTRARRLERDASVAAALPVLTTALSNVAHPQIRNRTTIGGNIAHGDPSSELPAVLAALEGTVRLQSQARGSRDVGWEEFFLSVFTTAKESDELVTAVVFPRPAGWTFVFREVARRQGDYPMAALCAGFRVVDGVIAEARLAASAVADRPLRLHAAELALAGMAVGDAKATRAAGDAAVDGWEPTTDLHGTADYRRGLLRTLVRRSADQLAMGAAS